LQSSPIDPAKPVAALIAQPPLVHIRVVTRLDAHHTSAVVQMRPVEHVMQVYVAPLTAAIAHGRRAREIPNPGLETEIPLGQCAHRADVNHVRGVRILERRTWINPDLAVVSAIENAELAGLGDLVGKNHEAGAKNQKTLNQ